MIRPLKTNIFRFSIPSSSSNGGHKQKNPLMFSIYYYYYYSAVFFEFFNRFFFRFGFFLFPVQVIRFEYFSPMRIPVLEFGWRLLNIWWKKHIQQNGSKKLLRVAHSNENVTEIVFGFLCVSACIQLRFGLVTFKWMKREKKELFESPIFNERTAIKCGFERTLVDMRVVVTEKVYKWLHYIL